MNVLKMTDSEVYQLGIKALTIKLGSAGVSRFLTINSRAPCTGDYTVERHEWLDKIDKETALREIEKMCKEPKVQRASREFVPTHATDNVKSLALQIEKMTDMELYDIGLETLVGKLGIAGMPRFIRLCAPGTGPSTIDR